MKKPWSVYKTPELDNRPRKVGKETQTPKPGLYWNPLEHFPDALFCFCRSQKFAVNCCKTKLTRAIPQADAERLLNVWDGLIKGKVFIDRSNAKKETH